MANESLYLDEKKKRIVRRGEKNWHKCFPPPEWSEFVRISMVCGDVCSRRDSEKFFYYFIQSSDRRRNVSKTMPLFPANVRNNDMEAKCPQSRKKMRWHKRYCYNLTSFPSICLAQNPDLAHTSSRARGMNILGKGLQAIHEIWYVGPLIEGKRGRERHPF